MTKAAAIYNFWAQFGLTAYEENSVFDMEGTPDFPYLTYELNTSSFDGAIPLSCSLWYRSTSWVKANAKAEEISETIGQGGVIVPFSDGYVWITRGSLFAQSMGDSSDDLIKRKVLNIYAEFFSVN